MTVASSGPPKETMWERHDRLHREQNERLSKMSALDALAAGLVARTSAKVQCGGYSPESHTGCRLDPSHEGAHRGWSGDVAWANEEPSDDC